MTRRIVFVTRRDCPLCEEAEPRVRSWANRLGLSVEVVDVDAAGLADRHGDAVPVVLGADGTMLASGRVGSAGLALGLLRARLGRHDGPANGS